MTIARVSFDLGIQLQELNRRVPQGTPLVKRSARETENK